MQMQFSEWQLSNWPMLLIATTASAWFCEPPECEYATKCRKFAGDWCSVIIN